MSAVDAPGVEERGARNRIVGFEIRQVVSLGSGTFAAAVLALLYQFLVGHALGPAEFADFATALSLVYFGAVAAGPVNATAARFSAEFAARGQLGRVHSLARILLRWVARFGFVACVVALIAVRPLGTWLNFRSVTPLLLAAMFLYFTLIVNLARGLLRGVQEFARYTLNIVGEAGLRLVFGIPLVLLLRDAASAVGGYLVALVILIPLSGRQVRSIWRESASDSVDYAVVRRFGVPMIVFALSNAGFLTVDIVLVKHLFENEQAGLYGGAITLARSIGLIYAPFGAMMIPLFVAEAVTGGRPSGTLLRICLYFVALGVVPILAFALWPSEILGLTLGSAFSQAAPILVPLAASMLLAGVSALIGNALAGLDRFLFLAPYTGGLLLETILLSVRHGSLEEIALLVLTVQALTAGAMILTAIVTPGLRANTRVI